MVGSEIRTDSFPLQNPGVLTITQSGETKDLIDPLKLALSKGIFCFNIINKVESTIAKMTSCGIFVNSG